MNWQKKMGIGLRLVLLMWTLLLILGCDSDDGKKNAGAKKVWLERMETTPGAFVPENIEAALDALVDVLNRRTEPQPNIKLAVIPKDLAEYFQIAALGSNRAISELGVIGSVTAPNEQSLDPEVTASAQNAIINPFIDQMYDGLAISPFNSYVAPTINAAVNSGAVVVTFDSDLADTRRQFYVGTDNTEAGKTAGQSLLSLLEGRVGTVVILGNTDSAWVDGYNRTMAARTTLEAAGNTVVICHSDWAEQSNNTVCLTEALQAAAPAPVGMLGVFSNSYLCADAAVAAGAMDSVQIAAFDFEATTLQYMQEGKIQVTHAQRQYYMGYLAPYIMYSARVIGFVNTKKLLEGISVGNGIINTGLDVIAADQITAYNDYLDSLGILN